ncbi:phosphatidylinositol-glycan biosynthesis class S protein-domain-containing protein [Limtongia smithiae]|uniref:phosphatidylinositol-glycan biosynthesis class S protein-domain-containing protein n=1 Tax=Limtongia smithiae TaxID=1125753 RepID=UPI0034CF1F35
MPLAPESPHDTLARRRVVLSFWSVFLLIGIPLWLFTTRIYRTTLPTAEIEALSQQFDDTFIAAQPGLKLEVPVAVDGTCVAANDDVRLLSLQSKVNDFTAAGANDGLFTIRLTRGDGLYRLECTADPSSARTKAMVSPDGTIHARIPYTNNEDTLARQIYNTFIGEILYFNAHRAGSLERASLPSQSSVLVLGNSYASSIHISFTLLLGIDNSIFNGLSNSDTTTTTTTCADGGQITKALQTTWHDLADTYVSTLQTGALRQYIPTLSFDSDVGYQYMGDNAHEWMQAAQVPASASSLSALLDTWTLQPTTLVKEDEAAEAQKVYQFVYFRTPSADTFVSANGKPVSFTVANWGGVVIGNCGTNMTIVSNIFRRQFEKLIAPASFIVTSDDTASKTTILPHPHEFTRIATVATLREAIRTLSSLAALAHSLTEMAVPKSVRTLTEASITEWKLAASDDNEYQRLSHAAAAARLARQAIFEKNMMLNMFVPFEHKVAVYMPLLGPALVPLLVGLQRIISEWKTRRPAMTKE